MILLGLILVAVLLVGGLRSLAQFAYMKMGEEYELGTARVEGRHPLKPSRKPMR